MWLTSFELAILEAARICMKLVATTHEREEEVGLLVSVGIKALRTLRSGPL